MQSAATFDADVALTDDVRAKLRAAIALPRPVFTSDLVASLGSEAIVEKWQDECRANQDADLWFIGAKPRHRLRGSLVLPRGELRAAAGEFQQSCWTQCMIVLRGAQLYELGVLLHRVGDQVVSHRIHAHRETALLRLNQQRGLIGVVVVFGSKFEEDGATRAALVEDIEELLRERLELLYVLAATDAAFEPMMRVVQEEAAARGWQPSMNVVAAKSWEFADGNSQAIRQLLG